MNRDRGGPRSEGKIGVVHQAQSRAEALIVVGVLQAAGIPAFVDGQFLNDEFAASQAVMNLGSVAVEVPVNVLEQARRILEEARDSGNRDPGDLPPSRN